jgi:hypothetical protein
MNGGKSYAEKALSNAGMKKATGSGIMITMLLIRPDIWIDSLTLTLHAPNGRYADRLQRELLWS